MVYRKWIAAATMAVAAAACSDTATVVEPALKPADASAARLTLPGGAPEIGPRHLVVFSKKAPKDFEATVASLGGKVLLNHRIGVALVEGLDDAAATELQERVKAQYVAPDIEFQLIEPAAVGRPAAVEAMAPSRAAGPQSAADPTTARYYDAQWNMSQIHAEQAWAAGRLGSSDVTVAILDTGIDYLLPDLVGRVDLSRSASFEPKDDSLTALYWPERHPSTDLHFHGTNVATQVASNASRFAGVTSGTMLMSVKVCSVLGGCHGVFQGILYAIDNGADVINMSLGGPFQKAVYPGAVAAYNRLMNYAAQRGVTVVVSAGNDAIDLDRELVPVGEDEEENPVFLHAPLLFDMYCNATHVICVSATRSNDEPASYTNYGRSAIDVAAPGGGGGDWVYALCPQTSLAIPVCQTGLYYLGVAGTSQAAPHVSGLAALAVEDVGRNPARVRAYIRNSADPIGGGNTPFYGRGRINVAKAVGAM